jgi:thioredoxin reductase (NADPH)
VNKPAILAVDDDPQVLAAVRVTALALSNDLRSPRRGVRRGGVSTIRELKARGDSLAIVVSDQRMPGMQGTDLLAQAREVYPLARRVLLTAYSDIDAAIKAINAAHVDHYLSSRGIRPKRLCSRSSTSCSTPGRVVSAGGKRPEALAAMVTAIARDQAFPGGQPDSV